MAEPRPSKDLNLLNPVLHAKIAQILTKLECENYKPFIIETKRSMTRVLWLIAHGKFASKNSLHLTGKAVDIGFLDNKGNAIWDTNYPGYKRMAQLAGQFGLTSGYYWRAKDCVHIQL